MKADAIAINHCGLTAEIQHTAKMDKADFHEAVMERAGQLIKAAQGRDLGTKPHKLQGVELVAVALANHVIEEGARRVAQDLGTNLDDLKKFAASQHISFC